MDAGQAGNPGGPRQARPVAVFDLDRTLLEGRTVMHLANRFGVRRELREIRGSINPPRGGWPRKTREATAALFEGVPLAEVERACSQMFFRPEAGEVVKGLQERGFAVGAATTSYDPIATRAKHRLKLQFAAGTSVEVDDGVLTGRLTPSPFAGECDSWLCKRAVLEESANRYAAPFRVAIGDGPSDVCMLEAADLAIAVERASEEVRERADVVVDLVDVPSVVEERLDDLSPKSSMPAPPIETGDESRSPPRG